MLLHGEADTDVPFAQSQRLANRLASLGVEHEMVSEPAWGHMFDAADWDKPAVEEAFLRVLTFLDKHTE
jgi:dipeptidyl aminopeptidase/acylaminoacyl peptidase